MWQIWLFPVLNSPKISVTEPVSIPPAKSVSSCLDPVVIEMSSLRLWCISVAVVKPIGTSFEAWAASVYGHTAIDMYKLTFGQHLCRLLFWNTLDLLKHAPRCVCYRFDGIKTTIDDQLDIAFSQPSNSLEILSITYASMYNGLCSLQVQTVVLALQDLRRHLPRFVSSPSRRP